MATEIAKDVNDEFWSLSDDDSFKIAIQDTIVDISSVLKIKISQYLKQQSLKEFPEQYNEEIHMLKHQKK